MCKSGRCQDLEYFHNGLEAAFWEYIDTFQPSFSNMSVSNIPRAISLEDFNNPRNVDANIDILIKKNVSAHIGYVCFIQSTQK